MILILRLVMMQIPKLMSVFSDEQNIAFNDNCTFLTYYN